MFGTFSFTYEVHVHVPRGETYVISNSEKDYLFLRKWSVQTGLSFFYYYFPCLDENKNKLSVCNNEKVLIFVDLMNHHISSLRTLKHNILITLKEIVCECSQQ